MNISIAFVKFPTRFPEVNMIAFNNLGLFQSFCFIFPAI